jgi:hypothetical protein
MAGSLYESITKVAAPQFMAAVERKTGRREESFEGSSSNLQAKGAP